jgi:hypothetical protein
MPCHAFGRRAFGRLRHSFGDGAQVNLRSPAAIAFGDEPQLK